MELRYLSLSEDDVPELQCVICPVYGDDHLACCRSRRDDNDLALLHRECKSLRCHCRSNCATLTCNVEDGSVCCVKISSCADTVTSKGYFRYLASTCICTSHIGNLHSCKSVFHYDCCVPFVFVYSHRDSVHAVHLCDRCCSQRN